MLKMKTKLILTLIIVINLSHISFSQNSNYYKVDINTESKVEIDKTVKTFDYGSMALAEAQKEKTKLESKIYYDNNQKLQAIEIASDPLKAFDYGIDVKWDSRNSNFFGGRQTAKKFGFNFFTVYHKRPNEALFVKLGNDNYSYINENLNGVTTLINLNCVSSVLTTDSITQLKNKVKKEMIEKWKPFFGDTEKYLLNKYNYNLGINNKNSKDEFILYKKELKKSIVWGYDGFVCTLIYESKYEKIIREEFVAITIDGLKANSTVTYKGNKDDISFEELESRRAYLGGLTKKLISSAGISNYKLNND